MVGRWCVTAATRDALGLTGGTDFVRDVERWAIVPAHELVPSWRVITVDGKHPLDADASGPLTIRRCGPPNIDPARVTTIAMTGTSALTRFVAQLMVKRGATYPARDVAPWLRTADFVHISHEVATVPECTAETSVKGMLMCAPPEAIEALEASHANIIELTGSHLADFGRKWIGHSIELFEERGWVWFGGGRTQLEAIAPRIIEHAGSRIAFLGCNMPWTTSKYIWDGPGVAACDLDRIESDVADLRRRGTVPIVSMQHEEVHPRWPLARGLAALHADRGVGPPAPDDAAGARVVRREATRRARRDAPREAVGSTAHV